MNQLEMEVNNMSKTMIVNENCKEEASNDKIKQHEAPIERVTTYEYLGTLITENGKIETETTDRANKSSKLNYALNKSILGYKKIDRKL